MSIKEILKFTPTSWCAYRTYSSNAQSKHYDIIIAGGGLVGTALACSIGKNKVLSEKSVLLLEGGPKFKGFHGGNYGNRVSALNNATVCLMKNIQAWNTITSTRYQPVKQMQIWDASSDASITFNHEQFSSDIAYIVENDLILHAIYKELECCNKIEIKSSSKVENVDLPRNGCHNSNIQLNDGEVISCNLLIGADGANSLVRQKMNIDNYTCNYNQMGLVATLELCESGDNSVAWQRFIPTGPVAMLPLNDNMSSLVWTTTPDEAKTLAAMPAEDFVSLLNAAFVKEYPKDSLADKGISFLNTVMGNLSKGQRQYPPQVKSVLDKSRACFPLGFGHASSYVTEGAALVGDAAHRIHPLAGQGVNLGFGDVQCLTDILSTAVYSGSKLGNIHHLLKYEQERLMKNVPIMLGVHGLQNLYNTTFSPIVLLRSIGLQFTQNIPQLKKVFMERAMG